MSILTEKKLVAHLSYRRINPVLQCGPRMSTRLKRYIEALFSKELSKVYFQQ